MDDGFSESRDSIETSIATRTIAQEMQAMLPSRVSFDEFLNIADTQLEPVRKMFADYQCAAMEIETKFRVLNERFSVKYDANPIESIKTRIKSPESILRKLNSKGYPITLTSMRENLYDIAGIRVVCSFVKDIYMLAEKFLEQDDIVLVERKDYIKNPKPSGYRSLHLIVQVPIFTEEGKKMMYAEVQLRTIAMDFWASVEHKLRYKKNLTLEQQKELEGDLISCAAISADLDTRMQNVYDYLKESTEAEGKN